MIMRAPKSRGVANASVDFASPTVNERILKECHALYTDPDHGLVNIAQNLNFKLLAPRKKITIMLIGNHSAGKSSFINWYIEETVQKTGVAIETQGFSLVTSGRRRESLTGNATIHLFPHFQPLLEFPGVVDFLCTEISTSKQKKFPLVTFVDTPGLVDGDMNYPFDVNQAILWLGQLADLIFVFFDPIGQALCKRTLNIVEALSRTHCDRMRFYLSKADEAGRESDRQRVMMQIVQELCKRPTLNRTGFDMPTIYIPNTEKDNRCINQIEEVCRDIEKTINQTIQTTLNTLERDCNMIGQMVDQTILEDNKRRSSNFAARAKAVTCFLLGITLLVAIVANFFASNVSYKSLSNFLGEDLLKALEIYRTPLVTFWSSIPEHYHLYGLLFLLAMSSLLVMAGRYLFKPTATLTRKKKKALLEQQEFVTNVVKEKKQSLYKEYLRQTVSEQDM